MMQLPLSEVTPTANTLIDAAFVHDDYRDAFTLEPASATRLEDFAAGLFLAQPRWLTTVSMNLGRRDALVAAVGDASFDQGSSVGSWKVYGRADNEIMFGDDIGFMEYRFSVIGHDDGMIEASTAVRYLSRLAPVYFTIVKPLHRHFMKVLLRNAATMSSKTGTGAPPGVRQS